MKGLVIIGAGGHGKVVSDIAHLVGYKKIIFLDDNSSLKKCGEYDVLGKTEDCIKFKDYDFVVAVGNNEARKNIQEKLTKIGCNIVTLIHPDAVISKSAKIAKGTVVMAGVVINSEATIGEGCIINTCASVDHECEIGNFVHISVGVHLAGNVIISEKTFMGMGSCVINNISINSCATVGAGAVVVKDIDDCGVYVGVPAVKVTL